MIDHRALIQIGLPTKTDESCNSTTFWLPYCSLLGSDDNIIMPLLKRMNDGHKTIAMQGTSIKKFSAVQIQALEEETLLKRMTRTELVKMQDL